MRKRIIDHVQQGTEPPGDWLNVEELAEVEITSEDAAYPIESALVPGGTSGWRAAGPGKQTIRLLFATPQPLQTDLAELRGNPHRAHARVCRALVAGWRTVVSGNRAAAVELQSRRRNLPDGRSSRPASGGHGARVEYHPGNQWGKCARFVGEVAACLTLQKNETLTQEV